MPSLMTITFFCVWRYFWHFYIHFDISHSSTLILCNSHHVIHNHANDYDNTLYKKLDLNRKSLPFQGSKMVVICLIQVGFKMTSDALIGRLISSISTNSKLLSAFHRNTIGCFNVISRWRSFIHIIWHIGCIRSYAK